MVSAEAAVAIPAILVVLGLGLSAVDLGIRQVRCTDAAGTAARQLARGDPEAGARRAALDRAPRGAVVAVVREGATVTVVVGAPAPAALAVLGERVRPRARATALVERT